MLCPIAFELFKPKDLIMPVGHYDEDMTWHYTDTASNFIRKFQKFFFCTDVLQAAFLQVMQ